MIFYIFFLVVIGMLLYIYSKKMPISKVAQVTSSILLVLLVICRYDIGYDYHTYYSLVEDKNMELIEFLFSPFSAYLAYIAVYFDSPHLIFILFGIPTFVLILCGISKNSKNYSLSVFIFICLFLINFLSVIRQALAVALCFYAYRYIVERKLFKYVCFVVIAALFHSSALIVLPFFWLDKIKFRALFVLSILFFGLKSILFNLFLELDLYTSYLSEDGVIPQGGSFILYFYILLFVFCILICSRNKPDNVTYFLKIIFLGITFALMFGPHLGERISLYFYIYYVLLIPSILNSEKYAYRKYFTKLFYFLFISYFFLLLSFPFIKGTHSFYVPYKTIFWN